MATPRSNSSRERILATAEAIILKRGYAGTTIEDIIENASITKGGFFYHFNGKAELARALIDRYIQVDTEAFRSFSERADSLAEDPLQQTLIFLNLFTEMIAGMTDVHPGCLAAAFTYEVQQFDDEIRQRIKEGMLEWRKIMLQRLEKIEQQYTPKLETSAEALADMFTACVEGGIILAMNYGNNQPIIDQTQNFRSHLRLIYGDCQ